MKKILLLLLSILSLAGYGQTTDATATSYININIAGASSPGSVTRGIVTSAIQNVIDAKMNRAEKLIALGTNTYTITANATITSYANFPQFLVQFTNGNTGASTINVNGIGAVSLRKAGGVALSSGDISGGQILWISYDGTFFQVVGSLSSGSGVTNPGQNFSPTAVKTSSYTAAAGELVPTDATAGNVPITLPTAPADKTTIAVKMVTTAAGNTTTIATGGSDVFNVSGGSTSISLVRSKQSKIFQYKATGAIWYVTGGDEALTSDPLYASNNLFDLISAPTALQNLGGLGALMKFNTQTGDYTFAITDAPTVDGRPTEVRMDKSSGQNLTVPPNGTVPFPIGTILYAIPVNTGMTTVVPGVGVTVTSSTGGYVTKKTMQLITFIKTATNTWDLYIGTPADLTFPASATAGDILRATSANTYTNLALGTSLQILRVNSGGTDIEWATNTATGWALTGVSTLTGTATITSNTASQHVFNGTWTASANNQNHMNFGGTFTARATASDLMRFIYVNPTMISGAATQTLSAFTIDPTFTPTGGASTNYLLRLMVAGTDKYTINDAGLANYVDAGGTTRLQMTTVSARIAFNNSTSHYVGNTGVAGTSATSTTHGLIFNALGTIVAGGAGGLFNFASSGFATNATGTHRIFSIPSNVIAYQNSGAQTATYIGFDMTPGISFANAGGTFTVYGYRYAPNDAAAIPYTNYGIVIEPAGARSGFGNTNPTAKVHMGAGTTAANTAPLKFTSGTNLTSVEAGAVEFDGTNFFASASTTRYTLAKTLTNTGTLDFGSTAAGTSTDLTITVTGAVSGDVALVGVPNGSTVANGSFTAWVSANDTVTVRFSNNNLVAALDPASGTFRASVIKY